MLLRSVVFNIAFILTTIIEMFLFAPIYFFLPRCYAWSIVKFWSRTILFLLKYIAKLDLNIKGIENIDAISKISSSYLIAVKHQSAWETFALLPYLDDPAFILKQELMWIPFFGLFMAKMQMIAINRSNPLASLKKIIEQAKIKIKQNRQILIFPEGTRSAIGQKVQYKSGIANLYQELNLPILPIAHNAGLYWPNRGWKIRPGVVEVVILPPIRVGLEKKELMCYLQDQIENMSQQLVMKASAVDKNSHYSDI